MNDLARSRVHGGPTSMKVISLLRPVVPDSSIRAERCSSIIMRERLRKETDYGFSRSSNPVRGFGDSNRSFIFPLFLTFTSFILYYCLLSTSLISYLIYASLISYSNSWTLPMDLQFHRCPLFSQVLENSTHYNYTLQSLSKFYSISEAVVKRLTWKIRCTTFTESKRCYFSPSLLNQNPSYHNESIATTRKFESRKT